MVRLLLLFLATTVSAAIPAALEEIPVKPVAEIKNYLFIYLQPSSWEYGSMYYVPPALVPDIRKNLESARLLLSPSGDYFTSTDITLVDSDPEKPYLRLKEGARGKDALSPALLLIARYPNMGLPRRLRLVEVIQRIRELEDAREAKEGADEARKILYEDAFDFDGDTKADVLIVRTGQTLVALGRPGTEDWFRYPTGINETPAAAASR